MKIKTTKSTSPNYAEERLPVRVLIADDRGRCRRALRAFLNTSAGVEIVAEAADGQEAIELVEQHSPDVMLMDVRMPVMDGIKATQCIKAKWPAVKVVIVSMYPSYELDALTAGADAFISKGASPQCLLTTLSKLA